MNKAQKIVAIIFAIIILLISFNFVLDSPLACIIGMAISAALFIYSFSGKVDISGKTPLGNKDTRIILITVISSILIFIGIIYTYEKKKSVVLNNSIRLDSILDEANKASWRKLETGMTQSQVRSILGEPVRIEVPFEHKIHWYYSSGGDIWFGKPYGTNDPFLLSTWTEPRW